MNVIGARAGVPITALGDASPTVCARVSEEARENGKRLRSPVRRQVEPPEELCRARIVADQIPAPSARLESVVGEAAALPASSRATRRPAEAMAWSGGG
jgi:hypothetical protein